jgi:cell division inhibitor SulA
MANALHVQKLIDNNKRALVKLVWLSDGTAEANTVMIDAASLGFAMNVNNMIMGAATDRKSNYRTTIKHICLSWHLPLVFLIISSTLMAP